MNLINNYSDLKFAIRCVDVWKNLKPKSDELRIALNYHKKRNNRSVEEASNLNSISLQEYVEMLIDVIQEETGTWFFYVDIAGVIFDQISNDKIFVYQTESGYAVIFKNK